MTVVHQDPGADSDAGSEQQGSGPAPARSLRVLLASDPDAEEQALDDDAGPPISSGTTDSPGTTDDIEAIDAERRG